MPGRAEGLGTGAAQRAEGLGACRGSSAEPPLLPIPRPAPPGRTPGAAGVETLPAAKNHTLYFSSLSRSAELTPPGQILILSLCLTSQNLKLHSVFLAALKGDRHILTNRDYLKSALLE